MPSSSSTKKQPRQTPTKGAAANSSHGSNTRRKLNSGIARTNPMQSTTKQNSDNKQMPEDIADVLGLSTTTSVRSKQATKEVASPPTATSQKQSESTNIEDSTIPSAINYSPNHFPLPQTGIQTDDMLSKSSISYVVTDKFFPQVKFVNKQVQMAWNTDPNSFCQFFISKLHVPVEIDQRTWWSSASKIICSVLCQTRNDRTTAVKYAFVGKYNVMSSVPTIVPSL